MASKQFCTFFLDDLFFGVNVLEVQEIIRYQDMTQVPLSNSIIRGLINLRGQIVTAIDLRQRLGLPPRQNLPALETLDKEALEELYMNVIIRSQDGAVSLLVDEIGDVLELEDDFFEPPPNNLESGLRKLVHGVYKLDQELLLILNTDKTIEFDATTGQG